MKKVLPFALSLVTLPLVAADVVLSDDTNVAGTTLELDAGDALVVPEADAPYEIKARIKVLGAATLAVPDGSGAVLMTGGLWAPDEGSLAVTGGDLLVGAANQLTGIDYPRFDCPVSFDAGHGLVLTNAVTVHRLPEASVPVAIAQDAILAVRGTNTLARFMDFSGEAPSFTATTDYTVQVHSPDAFPAGTVVTVKPGAAFVLKLCSDKPEVVPAEDAPWYWSGIAGVLQNIAEIRLESTADARSRLLDYCRKELKFYGAISGDGDFTLDAVPIVYEDRTYLYGNLTFKGTVTITGGNAALHIAQATPGDRENAIVCNGQARLSFPAPPGGETPANVYIHSLVTANDQVQIWHQGDGQTVEIGANSGSWKMNGPGSSANSLLLIDDLVDGTIIASTAVTLKILRREAGGVRGCSDEGKSKEMKLDLSECAGAWPLPVEIPDGHLLDVTGSADGAILVSGGGSVRTASGLTVQSAGANLSLQTDAGTSAMTVDVSGAAGCWTNKVALWFDAAETSSLHAYPDGTCYTNGFPLIMSWGERRTGLSGKYLHNGRSFASGDTTFSDRHDEVYPYVVKGGLNGRDYVSMGRYQWRISNAYQNPAYSGGTVTEARRLTLNSGKQNGARDPVGSVAAAYAILVFGSQEGGGTAVLGASDGKLGRTDGLGNAFFSSLDQAMYVDGVATRTQTAKPNGGWQILSFPMGGAAFNALGWNNGYASSGGQNYAEVILFSTAPTETERRLCEAYLAQKWGLVANQSAGTAAPVVAAYGDGSVTLASDAEIDGGFSGTVTVPAGRTLVVTSTVNPPPGEEAVPTENRIAWFDPDCAATVVRRDTTTRPLCVSALYNRGADGREGDTVMMGLEGDTDRRPWLNRSARGYGSARGWLDFSNLYDGDTAGNTLRHKDAYENSTSSTQIGGGTVREGFMVLDTSRGGGTPIGTSVNMDATRRPHGGTSAADPIWPGSSGVFSDIVTRLDNLQVDGRTTGYNGRPEVLGFTTSKNWTPAFFGSYQDGDTTTGGAEIIGESIFFSQPLSAATRAEVAAYLAYKWFGKVLKGYTDLSKMKVAGAGRVEVASLDRLPILTDDFAGTVSCTARAYAFTLDPAQNRTAATDAVTVAAPLALRADATITVTAATDLRPGTYTLIGGTLVLPGDTLPGLVFTGANPLGYRPNLVLTEEGLLLSVASFGTQIILR